MRVDLFEECTGVPLPEGEWQTVAGYVIAALDEIPAAGERVTTALGEFEVVEMDGYAIETLHVRLDGDGAVGLQADLAVEHRSE